MGPKMAISLLVAAGLVFLNVDSLHTFRNQVFNERYLGMFVGLKNII